MQNNNNNNSADGGGGGPPGPPPNSAAAAAHHHHHHHSASSSARSTPVATPSGVAAVRKKKVKKQRKDKPLPMAGNNPNNNNNNSSNNADARASSSSSSNHSKALPSAAGAVVNNAAAAANGPPTKKQRKKRHPTGVAKGGLPTSKQREQQQAQAAAPQVDSAQQAVYDQMRRALNEDKYSAVGSIVAHDDDDDPNGTNNNGDNHAFDNVNDDDADDLFLYRGQPVRLDRAALAQAAKKMTQAYWYPALQAKTSSFAYGKQLIFPDFMSQADEPWQRHNADDHHENDSTAGDDDASDADEAAPAALRQASNNTKKKPRSSKEKAPLEGSSAAVAAAGHGGRPTDGLATAGAGAAGGTNNATTADDVMMSHLMGEEDLDRDGGSIFGQTTGAANSTWVECDKCGKWRRLRGVVDEKKLPTKWYCSMNRNDPERARCSAPEEDYNDTQQTPESAADAKVRKHLRVWVRRLQTQEAFEARQPTLTRGKKRAAGTTSTKDPYEWVRCCNPSCGKWRVILRQMDAKSFVVAAENGNGRGGSQAISHSCAREDEWYCVMNTWDEKMASCAAPQENLPALGCPPWVMTDDVAAAAAAAPANGAEETPVA